MFLLIFFVFCMNIFKISFFKNLCLLKALARQGPPAAPDAAADAAPDAAVDVAADAAPDAAPNAAPDAPDAAVHEPAGAAASSPAVASPIRLASVNSEEVSTSKICHRNADANIFFSRLTNSKETQERSKKKCENFFVFVF